MRKQKLPDGSKSKKAHRISLVARTVVAVIALLWVFRGQDWRQLGKILAELNVGYFALSLGVFAAGQVLIGLRWWLLLRAQSVVVSLGTVVRLHFLGLFYNNLMPSSIGGDLLRAWYVAKHTDKKLEAALSVVVDRVIGFLGMVLIALVCYWLFIRGQHSVVSSSDEGGLVASLGKYKWILFWLLMGLGAFLCALALHRSGRAILRKAWSYVCSHGKTVAARLKDAVVTYCRRPLTSLAALALTIFLQSMLIVTFWLLGRNLGIDAGAKYYFVFFPTTWVVGALPISIGGIGIHEGGIKLLFTRFTGAGVEEVVALALCQRFVWLLASLPGAVIHLVGAHLPKDFFIDYKEPMN
ncbi:MAG: flippase-like domain-containing protein [Phycisphaerales bacterium]|nr:MAG: flippase-like domain-containing protein [Phycisphaerales bacterium]